MHGRKVADAALLSAEANLLFDEFRLKPRLEHVSPLIFSRTCRSARHVP
jgi:hypothetical protein